VAEGKAAVIVMSLREAVDLGGRRPRGSVKVGETGKREHVSCRFCTVHAYADIGSGHGARGCAPFECLRIARYQVGWRVN